jgi:hypothetical protein
MTAEELQREGAVVDDEEEEMDPERLQEIEDYKNLYHIPFENAQMVQNFEEIDLQAFADNPAAEPPLIASNPEKVVTPIMQRKIPDLNLAKGFYRFFRQRNAELERELEEDEQKDDDYLEEEGESSLGDSKKFSWKERRSMVSEITGLIPKAYRDTLQGCDKGFVGPFFGLFIEVSVYLMIILNHFLQKFFILTLSFFACRA